MGLYDSLYINCPKCGKRLEYQSKSGPCTMEEYDYTINRGINNLPINIAIGMKDNIVICQFCNSKWRFNLLSPLNAEFNLVKTKKKEDYDGNYNPCHPKSIKAAQKMKQFFQDKFKDKMDKK